MKKNLNLTGDLPFHVQAPLALVLSQSFCALIFPIPAEKAIIN